MAHYRVLTYLRRNQVVEILRYSSGGWVEVRTPGGVVGWVNSYYLR